MVLFTPKGILLWWQYFIPMIIVKAMTLFYSDDNIIFTVIAIFFCVDYMF